MPVYIRQYFGRTAIRNSDRQLMPAIFACNFSVCFLIFGIFLTISGVVFRAVAASSRSSISNSGYDPSQTAITVGTVIISIGSVLSGIGLVLLIFAFISFRRYEANRRNQINNIVPQVPTVGCETSFTSSPQHNIHYPTQPTFNPHQQQTSGYENQQLFTISNQAVAPPPYYPIEPQGK